MDGQSENESSPYFNFAGHAQYLRACLFRGIPSAMAGLDSNRLTLAYFCTSGLDLMGELTDEERRKVLEWVKKQQVLGSTVGGFRGSPFFVVGSDEACWSDGVGAACRTWDRSHIAMTYTALALHLICQGSLDGVDRRGVAELVREVQKKDGSVKAHQGDCESDVRFLFSAAACVSSFQDVQTQYMRS